jgi:AAA+ ATPase superfamily predicted ATPase
VPGTHHRRGFWQIADPFLSLLVCRVAPNRSRLDRGEALGRCVEAGAGDLDSYVGRIFEDVCRSWLGRYSEIEEAASAAQIGSWWSRRASRDQNIACANRRQYTLLGSCKWSRRLVDEDALEALLWSRHAIEGRAASAQLVLFVRQASFARCSDARPAGTCCVHQRGPFAPR